MGRACACVCGREWGACLPAGRLARLLPGACANDPRPPRPTPAHTQQAALRRCVGGGVWGGGGVRFAACGLGGLLEQRRFTRASSPHTLITPSLTHTHANPPTHMPTHPPTHPMHPPTHPPTAPPTHPCAG